MKPNLNYTALAISTIMILSNLEISNVLAADKSQKFTCYNPEGICIKKIEQAEDRVSVTIHNNLDGNAQKFNYFNLRYSAKGYTSGIIKIKPDDKPYTSTELKFGKVYKFEIRGCRLLASGQAKCTKWQTKNFKLQG
jgi:hypothetical protein